MTWAKFSDDFPEDCSDLSDAAYRLHSEGIIYTMLKLTEGRIQKNRLRFVATNYQGNGDADGLTELLQARYIDQHGREQRFWEDRGDHYQIIHQMEHQPSKHEVEHRRTVARVNGAKGGRPPKGEPSREPSQEPSSVSEGEETHAGNPVANPDPNPEGRAGTGQGSFPQTEPSSTEGQIDTETGEI
ncbi:hypothetical protein, partial [Nesterenkonia marinintestina]|uniref:hypothetical protein n=1 Tax=Nesterenkonia marinintestina TaxID=2979865 RepID=UPI0021C137E7